MPEAVGSLRSTNNTLFRNNSHSFTVWAMIPRFAKVQYKYAKDMYKDLKKIIKKNT